MYGLTGKRTGMADMLIMWPGPFHFEQILFPQPQKDLHNYLVKPGTVAFERIFEILILRESWVKSRRMTLTSCTHVSSYSHIPVLRPKFQNLIYSNNLYKHKNNTG